MTNLERLALGVFVAGTVAIFAWAAYLERRGYCISNYTCTANFKPAQS